MSLPTLASAPGEERKRPEPEHGFAPVPCPFPEARAFRASGAAGTSPFADYNVVYLDKCVGDRNLGDATVEDYVYRQEPAGALPVEEHVGPVYFHGQRLLRAILRGVHAEHGGTQRFDQVSFFTQSNGTNGLYMYLDRIAQLNARGGGSAKHAVNKFADLDPQEFREMYLGFNAPAICILRYHGHA